jgi:predicted porin
VTPQIELTGAYYVTDASAFVAAAGKALDSKRKNLVIAGTYALSKRTNFYVEADNRKIEGPLFQIGAAPGPVQTRQTGFSVGITHLF